MRLVGVDMASFSASDVALTGFRIVRERPRVVAIWAAVQFVISLIFTIGMVGWAGPALTSLNALNGAPSKDPSQAMALLGQLAPFYLVALTLSLVIYSIVYATMSRAVLRPSEEGFAYLRLGADELRQLGLLLLIVGIGIVAYIALIIALVVILVPVSIMTGAGHGAGGSLMAGLIAVLVAIAAIGAWIYVWVRLSLASPMTFATRRVDLFGSWRLTRGLFWPLFGAYAVAVILAAIVSLLTVVISLAVSSAVGGVGAGGIAAMLHPDMSSLGVYMTPGRIATTAIGAVSSALVWPVLLTPSAAIYRSLTDAGEASAAAATFD